MSKMFNKDGNHLSAKEICIVFGKGEILEVTAEEYAELERQIEIGKQEHEKVGELHSRLEKSLTELEELKRDVKRYFELQYKNQYAIMTQNEIHDMYVLREKLSKVGAKDE